jgi:hypothetical protein
MKIIGVDPGKNGWLTLTDSVDGLVKFKKLIFNKSNLIDKKIVLNFIESVSPDLIVCEKVMGRGGWGATQSFNFGFICGQIFGCFSDYQTVFVPPQSWQAVVCRGIIKTGTAKERTLATYQTLFPGNPLQFKKSANHDLLDSFMISIYGQIVFAKISNFNFKLNEEEGES